MDEERTSFSPKIDLPDGEGKALVVDKCTKCHELRGLSAYKGYWDQQQWAEMVESMVKNGAELDPEQASKVTDYLTRFFGPATRD